MEEHAIVHVINANDAMIGKNDYPPIFMSWLWIHQYTGGCSMKLFQVRVCLAGRFFVVSVSQSVLLFCFIHSVIKTTCSLL